MGHILPCVWPISFVYAARFTVQTWIVRSFVIIFDHFWSFLIVLNATFGFYLAILKLTEWRNRIQAAALPVQSVSRIEIIISETILTTLELRISRQLGSFEIWLEPKTQPLSGNLACPNPWNAQ